MSADFSFSVPCLVLAHQREASRLYMGRFAAIILNTGSPSAALNPPPLAFDIVLGFRTQELLDVFSVRFDELTENRADSEGADDAIFSHAKTWVSAMRFVNEWDKQMQAVRS